MPPVKTLATCLLLFGLAACDQDSVAEKNRVNQTGTHSSMDYSTARATKPARVLDVFEVGAGVYVRSLALESEANSLWVGTSLGVHEIDLDSYSLRNTFTRDHGLANEYVFAIGIDPEGNKWFGTNAGGMSRYREGEWKTYFPMHGLADYWVYAFANHPDGRLWVGTWAGANLMDRESEIFQTYVRELINEWVYAIDIDSRGRAWFGTEGGVSLYDGENWTDWSHEDGIGGPNPGALPFSRNTGLGTRSRHDLGVLSGGQATYNPGYVFSIMADQEDSIWVGTWGGGVSRFRDGRWTSLMEKDGLSGNIVYAIAQADDGSYWFGTNKGLSRFDGQRWDHWNLHQGLPANDVYAIEIEADGDVWIGTLGAVVRLGKDNDVTGATDPSTPEDT